MPNIEALQQLRRVAVEAPSDELFDMSNVDKKKNCGTAHCLLGWARIAPWFEKGSSDYATNVRHTLGIDSEQFDILFGFHPYSTDESGAEIKEKVIANIDRLIVGEELVPYAYNPDDEDDEDLFL